MKSISRSEFKQQLRGMDPTQFEHFVADLWSAQGWNTQVTTKQNDRGIDIVAERDSPVPEKHLIQAKRYGPNNSVGSPDIQQYASLRQQESNVDVVVVVTSGRFSKQAERIAKDLNIKLIDGDDLYNLVRSNSLFGVVDSYIGTEDVDRSSSLSRLKRPDQDSSDSSLTSEKKVAIGVVSIFILAILIASVVIFAAVNIERTGEPAGYGSLSVGESVTHGGLKFSVVNYTTTGELTEPSARFNENEDGFHKPLPVTAEPGSKFLAIQLQVTHVGENEREFPDNWDVIYKGERMNRVTVDRNVSIRNKNIVPYGEAETDAGATSGAYPGTVVNGWIVFEVPENIDMSGAVVRVEYGLGDGPPDTEARTLRWELADG
jgi:Restriction endonuclease